jgi:disulfide oxidoreductase YuzD
MKKQILTYFLVSISVFSCKKDIAEFEPTNPFEKVVFVENQTFDLNTISVKEIIGEKGTKIYFNREDFDIKDSDKVTLELKEYYSRLELISDNLNTITDKNELLESNGVVSIKFKIGDKEIKLKDGKKLKLKFAQQFRIGDRIFNGVLDSINQITWIQNSETKVLQTVLDSVATRRFGGVMTFKEKLVSIDSVDYYNRQLEQIQDDLIEDIEKIGYYPLVLVDDYDWINVDKILEVDSRITFELNLNKSDLEKISVFFIYNDLNSFISEYRKYYDLKFIDIPLKNESSMIVVGEIGNDFFVNRRILDDKTNGEVKIDLKKIDSTELKKLLIK